MNNIVTLKEKDADDSATEVHNEQRLDDSILDSDGELMSGQRSPQLVHSSRKHSHSHSESANLRKDKHPLKKMNRQPRTHDQGTSFKRPCRLASDEIPLLKRKIEKSKQSISKLKTHTEKGTCPNDLRYVAKANIFPDEEFKSDIRVLRKEAEQKFIGALTRFHYRRVKRNRDKLRRAKSHKPDKNTIDANRTRMGELPQPSTSSASSLPESIKSIT